MFRNWKAQDSFSPAIWISLAETVTAIWISLAETVTRDLDFQQIVMEMPMQYSTGETYEKDVILEELLFVLDSRLEGKKYLIVLDSI